MKTFKVFFVSLILSLTAVPALAEELRPAGIKGPIPPILVVDKCPEFCPPGILGPINPKRMCTQALIPVLGKKGWFWTDGCKTKMIRIGSKR